MDPETVEQSTDGLAFETEKLVTLAWDKVLGWVAALVEMLPNLAVAVLVVVLAALAARLASRLVERAARRAASNTQVVALLSSVTRVSVLALGLFVALGILQLEKTVTSLLAGIGVVGLALGFAFQDIANNFMSGVIMALREPFQIGDLIETHDTMGWVERVTLRATVVRNFWGQLVVIPNKDVLQSPIVNYSQTGQRRIEVPVGVAYSDDLSRAREAARKALEGLPDRDESKPVDVYWTGFGGSSIDMSARFWIDLSNDDTDYLAARSNAVQAIKSAFDEAGITIPFPIRTLDLGDEAGEVLGSVFSRSKANGSGSDAQSGSAPSSAR